jgi:iron complex outermembrane receptor protein
MKPAIDSFVHTTAHRTAFHLISRRTVLTCAIVMLAGQAAAMPDDDKPRIEEVLVTARKTEESLQATPLAISALSAEALADKGIAGLDDFKTSPSPFLRITPYGGSGSVPLIGIRGLSTDDPGQATNEPAVGVYLDGVYLGRAQGSAMAITDVERIEVLRGPQGTLFGRNALGGAVSIVSKKPTGQFGLEQTFSAGDYDALKSLTRLNLPEVAGLKTKLDYLRDRRDGWVKNSQPGAEDFFAFDRSAARVDVLWDAPETFSAEYVFDYSDDDTAFGYNQRATPGSNTPLPAEPDRVKHAQTPVPLEMSNVRSQGHTLTLAWDVSDALTLKSISSLRKTDYESFESYANFFVYVPLSATPATALSGLIGGQDDQQDQFSQEIQAVGTLDTASAGRFKYAAGLYYFNEEVDSTVVQGSTAYLYPNGAGNPAGATVLAEYIGFADPVWVVNVKARSLAAYAQTSWTPPVLEDRLEATLGLRYTDDHKEGSQTTLYGGPSNAKFDFNGNKLDYNLSLQYAWTDSLRTYARAASAYRSGGVSLRDPAFVPYDNDEVTTYELGLKSDLWDQRVRVNLAAYHSDFDDMRTSFSDPLAPTTTRLFNADGTVKIDGIEAEVTLAVTSALTFTAAYNYMDTDVPDQANPFAPTVVQRFELSQAPTHSGSLAVDWEIAELIGGMLHLHADAYSTGRAVSVPQLTDTGDSYNLFNARLSLKDIPVGAGHTLTASLWAKNLTDEEYRSFEMRWFDNVGPGSADIVQYGEPRTIGADVTFKF